MDVTTKHCNTCNLCVHKFDHHCVWMNTCIGGSNYNCFLGYVSSHLVSSVVYIISIAVSLASGLGPQILKYVLLGLNLLVLCFLLQLFIFHLYLKFTGKTTYDFCSRGSRRKTRPELGDSDGKETSGDAFDSDRKQINRFDPETAHLQRNDAGKTMLPSNKIAPVDLNRRTNRPG